MTKLQEEISSLLLDIERLFHYYRNDYQFKL